MLTGDKNIKEMKRYLKIRIDTVDSIQGRDSDVVIFSITRNWGTSFFFANYKRPQCCFFQSKAEIMDSRPETLYR